jgi:hypothetical protein
MHICIIKEKGKKISFFQKKSMNKPKDAKDLHNVNCKTMKKEIKKGTRRWKQLPCSWTDRIKIVKVAIIPKLICISSAIHIKTPMTFFAELRKKS